MNDLHQLEIEGLKWLYQFRTPGSDVFFRFMNYFDRSEFYILLFPLIWYGFSRTWGIRLFFWLMLNSICNFYFKSLFDQPRPFDLDPSLGLLAVKHNGFPSGAAQSSLFLTAAFIKTWKSSKAWIIGIAYLGLICFSRVYLGVHFPSDILGGLSLGAGVFILFLKVSPQVEKWIARKSAVVQFLLLAATALLAYLPMQVSFMAQTCAAIVSVGSGLILTRLFKIPNAVSSLKNAVIAMGSVIGIAYLEKVYFNNALGNAGSTALIGFWLSFFLPCFLAFPTSLKNIQKA